MLCACIGAAVCAMFNFVDIKFLFLILKRYYVSDNVSRCHIIESVMQVRIVQRHQLFSIAARVCCESSLATCSQGN